MLRLPTPRESTLTGDNLAFIVACGLQQEIDAEKARRAMSPNARNSMHEPGSEHAINLVVLRRWLRSPIWRGLSVFTLGVS